MRAPLPGPLTPNRSDAARGGGGDVHLPEVLSGLHPAAPHPCPRCGTATAALANGRGRLDICKPCGTFELTTHEGLEVFSLRAMGLPLVRRGG